jgi:hypothetical protein
MPFIGRSAWAEAVYGPQASGLFLQFVVSELEEESHQELGLFHATSRLRDRGSLAPWEETYLQQIRDWFNQNPEKPSRLIKTNRPG